MPDLILLPTLERLHPHDDAAAGKTAFGLTLSVALGEGKDKLADLGPGEAYGKALLQPWTWKREADLRPEDDNVFVEIAKVMLYSTDAAHPGLSKPLPVQHEDRIPDFDRPLEERFKAFAELEKTGTPWRWVREKLKVGQESRPWPGFVANLSQYPYPLPQALRLSFFLELDQDLGLAIAAAPILRLRRGGTIIELIPQPPALEDPLRLAYKWPDPASVPLQIEAQTVACETNVKLSSTFFDFADLWLKNDAPKNTIANAEWRAGLELRLAEQLHLTRILVDWMKENRTNAELISKYPQLVWSAIQKLRLVLGPGLREGPDGSFLKRASAFLDQLPKPFPDDAIKALQQTATTFFSPDDPKKSGPPWVGWLREAVSGLKGGGASSGLLDAAAQENPIQAIASALSLNEALAELDQLLASVAEPETLRTLFKLQWTALVEAKFKTPGTSDEEKLARALAAGLPPEVDLQRLLLLDHLGRHWKTLREAFAGSPTMEDVRKGLKRIYTEILKSEKIPLASTAADRFAELVLPKKLDDVEPRGTRGLTFQVDTLGGDDQGDKDLLRHMRGVAFLMRRAGETDYHCLNLAAARIGSTVIDPVLIPSRLAYVNDLRSPTVTYDNGPLTVAGPLSAAKVAGAELRDDKRSAPRLIDEPLIELTCSKKQIPGLAFNKTYEVLPFLVTSSGALPKELAAKPPWKIKDVIPKLPGRTPISGKYLREAHVGALRFSFGDASGLPPIPANVAPQIRELPPEKVLPADDPLLKKKKAELQTDSALAGTPLLLLAAPQFPRRPGVGLRDQLAFQVSPPAVDLQTWDRWVAADLAGDAGKNRRKFVWRSFYQLAHDKGLADRKLEDAGVYLDDPAVAGIWAELVRIDPNGTRTLLKRTPGMALLSKPSPFKPADPRAIKPDFSNWKAAACTLFTEQHAAIPVSCAWNGDTLTVKVGPDGGAQETLAGQGRLFCLSFYAFMKDGDDGRFSKKGGEEEYVRTDVSPRGTSPWHLLIEIPQALPRNGSVSTALRSSLKPSFAGGALKVDLDMNDGPLSTLSGHVYRAELMHQIWSWRGRPPADHPDLVKNADPLAFHMSEFGERSDDEHRRLPLPRRAPDPKKPVPEPVFHYEEDLARQGPEGELRALHHRFSARVFSRWEGILPDGEGQLEAQDETSKDRWQPLFVPCRRRHAVPVPKVKLALPLTAGVSEEKTGGPGLLVVVDGSWYEVGGLAEGLEVEVMKVFGPEANPDHPQPDDPEFFQIGTDPIFTQQSVRELPGMGTGKGALSAREADKNKLDFKLDGAIGHQRDHSRTNPRFLASSFLLSRPTIKLNGGQTPADVNLEWCFLKLRFRRSLRAQGAKDPVLSEPSAPFWVQFLPGVERVEKDWFGGSETLDVSLQGKTLSAPRIDAGLAAGRPDFQIFAVMTRSVTDFAGRPDQEAYLGVWRWDPAANAWAATQDLSWESDKDLNVRFIEVQSRNTNPIGKGDELWGRIFDADQPDAERARIVRISKRFCVNRRCP